MFRPPGADLFPDGRMSAIDPTFTLGVLAAAFIIVAALYAIVSAAAVHAVAPEALASLEVRLPSNRIHVVDDRHSLKERFAVGRRPQLNGAHGVVFKL